MISNAFIYKNKLTRPYVYSRLWAEPEVGYSFEIAIGESSIARFIATTSEVFMLVISESPIIRSVERESRIDLPAIGESTVEVLITGDSMVTASINGESVVYEH